MRVATWNPNAPAVPRAHAAARVLADTNPDIAVLCKTTPGIAPREGATIRPATTDPDYPANGTRRVLLWTRWPTTDHDPVGAHDLPPGRFVAATIHTPTGPVRVVGVCAPWRDAHVTSGRRDSAWWEEHIRFMAGLSRILERQPRPLIVAGDMNQQVPRRLPKQVTLAAFEALTGTLAGAGLEVITADTPGRGRPIIDHIAISRGLESGGVEVIDARPVTTHDVITASLRHRPALRGGS